MIEVNGGSPSEYAHVFCGPSNAELTLAVIDLVQQKASQAIFGIKLFNEVRELGFNGVLEIPFNIRMLDFTVEEVDSIRILASPEAPINIQYQLGSNELVSRFDNTDIAILGCRAPWLKEGKEAEIIYNTVSRRGFIYPIY